MVNILMLGGWNNDGSELNAINTDSDLKYLEGYASELHNGVECINKILKKGKYVIETKITGEENNYKLSVKIKYYGEESEYEHKENSHRQEIDI